MKPTIVCEGKKIFIVLTNDKDDEVRYNVTAECLFASMKVMAEVIRTCRDDPSLRCHLKNHDAVVLEHPDHSRMLFQIT